jgi:AraC-like DNA-binding protein
VYHPQTCYLDFQLVEEGEMIVEYAGEKYIVPEKSAILIPPGESRISIGSSSICRKRFLGIYGTILQTHLPALNLDSVKIIPDFQSERFEELYSQLYSCFKEKNPDMIPVCGAMTYELLLLLSRSVELGQYPPELQKALCCIKRYLKDNLTLQKLSTASGCSAGTLQGLFKKYLNKSPIQFLISTRMKLAEQLLKNTNYTIKEIAAQCGYCNQLYFSNVFHEHYGCSPKEYRKKQTPAGR